MLYSTYRQYVISLDKFNSNMICYATNSLLRYKFGQAETQTNSVKHKEKFCNVLQTNQIYTHLRSIIVKTWDLADTRYNISNSALPGIWKPSVLNWRHNNPFYKLKLSVTSYRIIYACITRSAD